MVQRGDRTSFPLEASTELLSANLDGDLAAQASVNRPINTAHASGADRSFDLVRSKLGAGGQLGSGGIVQQVRCAFPRRPVQRRTLLRQQRFDLAAQFLVARG